MAEAGSPDEQLVAGAVAAARQVGVPMSLITRVLREESALDDDFTPPTIAGRLLRLARDAA